MDPATSTSSVAPRIVKVFDYDCPICEHLTAFDGNIIMGLKERPHFSAVELGQILNNPQEKPDYARYAYWLERYACNDDYTLDLPVYLILRGKDYLGHINGEITPSELRKGLEEKLNGTDIQGSGL